MSDRGTLITGGVLGAAIGVAVSYMYFTEEGRAWRSRAEESLASLAQEADKILGAVDQVRHGMAEIRGGQGNWPRTA